jgi:hypothetical protein
MSTNAFRGSLIGLICAQAVIGFAETVTLDGHELGSTFEGLRWGSG